MSETDDIQLLMKLLDPRLATDQTDLYRRALEQFDRVILRRALERCDGNLTRAAALLGLSRVTLRSKLRSLGLSAAKTNASERSEGTSGQAGSGNAPGHIGTQAPQGHPHTPQTPAGSRDVGQGLTRQDKPGAGFSEPHSSDTARREAVGFRNSQAPK
jgi:hypothetical protein